MILHLSNDLIKRSNRSFIGTMNDAILMAQCYQDHGMLEPGNRPLDERLNMTPYKAIGYHSAERLLPELLGGHSGKQP